MVQNSDTSMKGCTMKSKSSFCFCPQGTLPCLVKVFTDVFLLCLPTLFWALFSSFINVTWGLFLFERVGVHVFPKQRNEHTRQDKHGGRLEWRALLYFIQSFVECCQVTRHIVVFLTFPWLSGFSRCLHINKAPGSAVCSWLLCPPCLQGRNVLLCLQEQDLSGTSHLQAHSPLQDGLGT